MLHYFFIKLYGDAPTGWVGKVEQLFNHHRTPAGLKVPFVSSHLSLNREAT